MLYNFMNLISKARYHMRGVSIMSLIVGEIIQTNVSPITKKKSQTNLLYW